MQLGGYSNRTFVRIVQLVHLERVTHIDTFVCNGIRMLQRNLYPSLCHCHVLREHIGNIGFLAVDSFELQFLRQPYLQVGDVLNFAHRYTHGGNGHTNKFLIIDTNSHIIVLLQRCSNISSVTGNAHSCIETVYQSVLLRFVSGSSCCNQTQCQHRQAYCEFS